MGKNNPFAMMEPGPSMGRVSNAFGRYGFAREGANTPAVMAFMGLPAIRHKNGIGDFGNLGLSFFDGFGGRGGGGGGGGNGGGGNGGGGNGNDGFPGDKYGKNLIPEWWKQWYKASGQYGGVPPVEGLI